jgi:hypothetical protein
LVSRFWTETFPFISSWKLYPPMGSTYSFWKSKERNEMRERFSSVLEKLDGLSQEYKRWIETLDEIEENAELVAEEKEKEKPVKLKRRKNP